MTDYTRRIGRIEAAQSLGELHAIVNEFSAQARGEGGILYTGKVGTVDSMVIAQELARKTGLPIINDTPRAHFLSNQSVEIALRDTTKRILAEHGMLPDQAKKAAADFLYGNGKAPPESPVSVKNSLWGEASTEFAGSLRGPVVVVGSAANAERVLAQAEVPAVLHANLVTTLGDHSLASLRELHAQGGTLAVLPTVQTSFIDASSKGIFIDPGLAGKPVTQVAISREAATTLGLDGSKFVGAAALSEAGFVPAPLGPAVPVKIPAPGIPELALAPEVAAVRDHLSSGPVRGATALGAAAVVYDATTTATHTSDLLQQGNIIGVRSELLHFGGRNLGALGGAALGAEMFGTAGAETGPFDLLIGGAGAIGGAIAGEKLANAYDNHRIYNQPDAQEQTWHYDPDKPQQGWTRDVPPLPDTPRGQHLTAPPALADRLNYQASSVAVELALSHAPRPQDAYSLPAGIHDTPSIRESPWIRDAQTHGWSRMVATAVLEHGMVNAHEEHADPRRTLELNRESEAALAHNAMQTPHAIAARYQSAYEQFGWNRFGPLPDPVAHALHESPARQQAPDGDTYTRNAQGQWTTPTWFGLEDRPARGNLRDELDDACRRQSGHGSSVAPVEAGDPRPGAAAPITRHSSNREMFDALSDAVTNKDVEAMRAVGQAYMQSDRGQAWLAQGQQFNQQQALTQQQAALAAQQQAHAQQGPVR